MLSLSRQLLVKSHNTKIAMAVTLCRATTTNNFQVATLHQQSHSQAQQTSLRNIRPRNDIQKTVAATSMTLSSPYDPPVQISRINTHYCREPQLVMIEGFGILQGEMDKSRVLTKYLNIPFATVQDPRQHAVAPEPWRGIRDATILGPMCPQAHEETNSLQTLMLGLPGPGFEYSERDCLNLNIFAPRCVEDVPVICYIHGGLTRGGNALPKNDASNIVQKSVAKGRPVIVVTINYRLLPNAGLLSSGPGQQDEKEDNNKHLGLHDQKIALEWVRKHIHNFGGNPNEITLMGHSSGRVSLNGESSRSPSSESGYHMMTRPKKMSNNLTSESTKSTLWDGIEEEEEHLFKRAIIHSEQSFPGAVSNAPKEEMARLTEMMGAAVRGTTCSSPTSSIPQQDKSMLQSQLIPLTDHNSSRRDHRESQSSHDRDTEEESVGFSFMSDACLPFMTAREKQLGFEVIDRWIDFAYDQEGETIDGH